MMMMMMMMMTTMMMNRANNRWNMIKIIFNISIDQCIWWNQHRLNNLSIYFQNGPCHVGLSRRWVHVKLQMSLISQASDLLSTAVRHASEKPKIVLDLTSNGDHASCVNSVSCPMMLPTQTYWSALPGIIMPSFPNPLFPGIFECDFKCLIVKQISVVDILNFSIFLRWIVQDHTDNKSTFIQLMGCYRRTTSHYRTIRDPDVCRHVALLARMS